MANSLKRYLSPCSPGEVRTISAAKNRRHTAGQACIRIEGDQIRISSKPGALFAGRPWTPVFHGTFAPHPKGGTVIAGRFGVSRPYQLALGVIQALAVMLLAGGLLSLVFSPANTRDALVMLAASAAALGLTFADYCIALRPGNAFRHEITHFIERELRAKPLDNIE